MPSSLLSLFTPEHPWILLLLLIIGIAFVSLLSLSFLVPVTARLLLPLPKDTRLADYLPFDSVLEDAATLVCRHGELVRCLEVEGCDTTFMSAIERTTYYQARKEWLDALSDLGIYIRVFTLRIHATVEPQEPATHPLLSALHQAWHHSFRSSYRNRQVIVLSKPGTHSKYTTQALQQATDITLTLLAGYRPRLLTQDQTVPSSSALLAFWGQIISPISLPTPAGMGEEVTEMLTADTVMFGDEAGEIRFQSGERTCHMAVMGIRMFGEYTDEAMMQELSHIAGESVILHLVEPWHKGKASLTLLQQQRMVTATGFSPSMHAQFATALEAIEGFDETAQTLARYSVMLFLKSESQAALTGLEQEVRKICGHYGTTAVREGVAAQASWFSQFPGYSKWPRSYKFFSSNIATLITLQRAPEGQMQSDWGEGPIALFRTAGGTPYYFQFHVSTEKDAVAHGVTIGPTGGGKTTLVCFLTAMAMRHAHLRCYIFDRYHGAKIFCQAAGGHYLHFDTGNTAHPTLLNPFQCSDTATNRHFLQLWLSQLSECDDPDSVQQIALAIAENFTTLQPEERSLAALFSGCFTPFSPLRQRLQRWVDPSLYGSLFNATRDTLDLASTRLVGFDFTRIFEDEALTRAALSYLMHRIQTTLTEHNAPALIFIDETEPMLKHPLFKQHFMVMLQEYRKRGIAVISAFQRPEAITQAGMGEVLRGQAQTVYFLPNPAAKEEDYKDWQLSDREWAFITGKLTVSRKLKRALLVKRVTGESVVLDTDLSPLGPYLKIFSSGRHSIHFAQELEQQYGPEWVQHYLHA